MKIIGVRTSGGYGETYHMSEDDLRLRHMKGWLRCPCKSVNRSERVGNHGTLELWTQRERFLRRGYQKCPGYRSCHFLYTKIKEKMNYI